MTNLTIEISKEAHDCIEIFRKNNEEVNVQEIINIAIIKAINEATLKNFGRVLSNPIKVEDDGKTTTELLREARDNGDIIREIKKLIS